VGWAAQHSKRHCPDNQAHQQLLAWQDCCGGWLQHTVRFTLHVCCAVSSRVAWGKGCSAACFKAHTVYDTHTQPHDTKGEDFASLRLCAPLHTAKAPRDLSNRLAHQLTCRTSTDSAAQPNTFPTTAVHNCNSPASAIGGETPHHLGYIPHAKGWQTCGVRGSALSVLPSTAQPRWESAVLKRQLNQEVELVSGPVPGGEQHRQTQAGLRPLHGLVRAGPPSLRIHS
jgi:hypothetical protein